MGSLATSGLSEQPDLVTREGQTGFKGGRQWPSRGGCWGISAAIHTLPPDTSVVTSPKNPLASDYTNGQKSLYSTTITIPGTEL